MNEETLRFGLSEYKDRGSQGDGANGCRPIRRDEPRQHGLANRL